MQEQIVKIQSEHLNNHNQLEIVKNILWLNNFQIYEYKYGHFSFLINGESAILEFSNNELIITSYLSYEVFNNPYKIINDTINGFDGIE